MWTWWINSLLAINQNFDVNARGCQFFSIALIFYGSICMYCTRKHHIHDNAPCKDPTILHKGTTGKLVMSRKNPSLSIFENLQYCPGVHELVPARKQSKCKYCQYLVLVLNRKEAPPAEKSTWLKCNICNVVHLYQAHFDVFHKKQ